ncbi:MAG: hypothetical protein ACFFAE_19975 [Candidatus Hodarchaeota archaeon]
MKKSLYMIILIMSLGLLAFKCQKIVEQGTYEYLDRGNNFKVAELTTNARITHNFQDVVTVTSGPNNNYSMRNVAAGYPHPDGKPRIAFGSPQIPLQRITIFKEDSPFNFIKEFDYFYSDADGAFALPVLMYDFTEDGLDEILVLLYSHSTGHVAKFLSWNGSDYVFIEEDASSMIDLDSTAHIHDIDRDGRPELITQQWANTYIYSWDTGLTNFRRDAILTGGASYNIGLGDIDNDNEDEIITSAYGQGRELYVYGYNNGNYEQEYMDYFYDKGFSNMMVVDIDNDGQNELIGTSSLWYTLNTYAMGLFEWTGSGLTYQNISDDSFGYYDAKVGDIDGDGLVEVITWGGSTYDLLIIEQASNGSIVIQRYDNISFDIWLKLFDFDGDTIPELVVSPGGYSNQKIVYQNDVHGPPAFIDTPPSSITVEQNSIGHTVSWTPIDRQNLTYYLYWESSMIDTSIDWFSGVPIVCSLNYRIESPGTYNLTVVVVDDDLNKVTRSVFISVVSPDVPTISNVKISPVNPIAGENVTISANITDRSGIFSAVLYYQVDNTGWYTKALIWQFDDIYQAEIGPFMIDQEVEYYITATDDTTDQNMATDNNLGAYYSFKLVDTTGPTITNVHHSPSDPIEGNSINIYADVEDKSGIANVEVYIQTYGGWTSMSMEIQSGNTYRVNIGSFAADTKVQYYIKAYDASDSKNEAIDDNNGEYYLIYISSLPKLSTEQTTTFTETEEISTESTSEQSVISIGSPFKITGLELTLIALAVVFYQKHKTKQSN